MSDVLTDVQTFAAYSKRVEEWERAVPCIALWNIIYDDLRFEKSIVNGSLPFELRAGQ